METLKFSAAKKQVFINAPFFHAADLFVKSLSFLFGSQYLGSAIIKPNCIKKLCENSLKWLNRRSLGK